MLLVPAEAPCQSIDSTALQWSDSPHRLGFPATSTFRFLSRGDDQVYDLNYRYRQQQGRHLRASLSLRYNSSDSDQFILNTRVGLDRVFKQSANHKWQFYTGADLALGIEKRSTGGRWYYAGGIVPFIGAQYRITEHFSLSTEPGFLLQVRHLNETDSFNTPEDETWFEAEFMNIGQILISFHF